jgi:flagellar biosynthetic protein FlhB
MAENGAGGQERTEQATPRRRARAREEGQIPRSQELATATVLLAGTAALGLAGGAALARFATAQLRASAQALSAVPFTPAGAVTLAQATGWGLLAALLPFAATVTGAVLFVNLVQAHGVLTLKPLLPKASHINPVAGLKRLVGTEALVNLVKSVLKVVVLAAVAWLVVSRAWEQVLAVGDLGTAAIAVVLREVTLRLALVTGLVFAAIAAADYLYQRFRFERNLRMTREEVRQEHKDTEGNPMVKARMLSIARALARKRMLQQVPKADVVIVNPTQIAVALRYDPAAAPAPIVVAMGQRKLAQRIRDIARRADVPVVENRPVARALLATATVGKPIPPALYVAVAEILAFVYRLRSLQRGPARLDGARPADGSRP